MTVIHFDLSGDILPDTITVTSSPETAVTALFARLSSGLAEGEPTLEQMSVFYTLLARLSMPPSDKRSRTPDKINEAKRLFDEQFPDPYLSISEIAARLGISTAYLRREFSACFGTSPINYLKSARLSKAKAMLQRLFEHYVAHPEALPEDFHPQLSFDGMERTVCDYIAGMTDNYAVDKYTEIFIPSGWQVRG